jgi:hypothetical protein
MTVQEITRAIDDGHKVELYDGAYEVIKDRIGQYLIHCLCNDNHIGLSGMEGTEYENVANYPEKDFYVIPQAEVITETPDIERRLHIPLGYKTYTGKCFTQQVWVDTYNRIQDRINSFIDAGAVVPESLLNESHRYFRDIATL